jgi:hypothetical protein
MQKKPAKTRYPTNPVVVRVDITSALSPNLTVAQTHQIVAVVYSGDIPNPVQSPSGGDGSISERVLTGKTVTYETSNAAVATVSAGGLVTAQGAGTCTITAVCEGIRSGTRNPNTFTVTNPQNSVASVVVTPTSVVGDTGTSVQLSADALDASLNVLTGKTVTWSEVSGGTLISTGADSGDENHTVNVTLDAAGSASVRATCDGINSNTVTLTISVPGATTYFTDDFSSGSKASSQGGWGWSSLSAGADDALPVITSVNPYPGKGYSMQFEFGDDAVGGDAWSEQRFTFGQGVSNIYCRVYLYFPDGTEGFGSARYTQRTEPSGGNNNKFFLLWDELYSPNYYVASTVEVEPNANGDSHLVYKHGYKQASGAVTGVGTLGNIHSFPTLITDAERGRWTKWQYRSQVATGVGANDGVQELWIDDVLKFSQSDINVYSPYVGANGLQNYWKHGYFFGWANTGYTARTRIWMGPVKFASAYITD